MEQENAAVVSKSNVAKKRKPLDEQRTEDDEQNDANAKSMTKSKRYMCMFAVSKLATGEYLSLVVSPLPYFRVAGPRNKKRAKSLTNCATLLLEL